MKKLLFLAGLVLAAPASAQMLQSIVNGKGVAPPPSFNQGVDFRASCGYVSDPALTACETAAANYPHSPTAGNSTAIGWSNASAMNPTDRNNAVDPRLAGINFSANGSTNTYTVALGRSGATFDVTLALGDMGFGSAGRVQVFDGASNLLDITWSTAPTAALFVDAANNTWTSVTWPGSNVVASLTFAGSSAAFTFPGATCNGSSANFCQIAHLRLVCTANC